MDDILTALAEQVDELDGLVVARRTSPSETALTATGPDGAAVLDLVRTFARSLTGRSSLPS